MTITDTSTHSPSDQDLQAQRGSARGGLPARIRLLVKAVVCLGIGAAAIRLQQVSGDPDVVIRVGSAPRSSPLPDVRDLLLAACGLVAVAGLALLSLRWKIVCALTVPMVLAATLVNVNPVVTEPLAPAGGIFGPGSEWRRNIAGASLAANSKELTANLAGQVQRYYGHAAFNAYDYNATFYTVGAGTPRADVIWDDCQGKGYTPPQLYLQPGQPGFEGAHFRNVPMPANAVTAVGTDKSIAVYDPATDQLWEFWIAQKKADGWHACWGGRIDKASTAPGYFLNGMGSSATGLPTAGGMIRIKEIQAGRIDHALSLAIVDTENFDKVSYPAQRSDGYNPQRLPNAIWEGTRFRLDPTIDVNTLNLHPVAKIVARAAQQYGFIVTDKAGAVSVIAESGAGVQAATQSNPWGNRNATTGRMGPGLLGGSEAYQIMAGFPWDRMQALPVDYAKP